LFFTPLPPDTTIRAADKSGRSVLDFYYFTNCVELVPEV